MAAHGLAPFIFRIMPQYLMGWVHKEICDKLDRFLLDVQEGRSPRLMITMPPRHGKSELASRMFPAYALGRNPDLSIIATSYSADLASRMNRDVQRIIESEEYRAIFPGTALYGKNIRTVASGAYMRNSDIFEVVGRKGVYRSSGVGGGITGMGGDINVTIEVSGGHITVTDISPNNETQGIGGYEAIEDGTYAQQVEAAQSAQIDGVAGATVTSKAIEAAVRSALKQAAK